MGAATTLVEEAMVDSAEGCNVLVISSPYDRMVSRTCVWFGVIYNLLHLADQKIVHAA